MLIYKTRPWCCGHTMWTMLKCSAGENWFQWRFSVVYPPNHCNHHGHIQPVLRQRPCVWSFSDVHHLQINWKGHPQITFTSGEFSWIIIHYHYSARIIYSNKLLSAMQTSAHMSTAMSTSQKNASELQWHCDVHPVQPGEQAAGRGDRLPSRLRAPRPFSNSMVRLETLMIQINKKGGFYPLKTWF